jgi:hypothetical protein
VALERLEGHQLACGGLHETGAEPHDPHARPAAGARQQRRLHQPHQPPPERRRELVRRIAHQQHRQRPGTGPAPPQTHPECEAVTVGHDGAGGPELVGDGRERVGRDHLDAVHGQLLAEGRQVLPPLLGRRHGRRDHHAHLGAGVLRELDEVPHVHEPMTTGVVLDDEDPLTGERSIAGHARSRMAATPSTQGAAKPWTPPDPVTRAVLSRVIR